MITRNGRFICTLVFAMGTAALGAGCVVHGQANGNAEATAPVVFSGPPTLVAIDGSIWVVRDAEYPVYFVDDDYWVIRDSIWYRSPTYDGGWVVVEASVVPTTIVSRKHATYIHYQGSVDAKTRPAPRPGETATAPEHDEKPGVGNERKSEGTQPGKVGKGRPAGSQPDKKGDKKHDKGDDKR